jgi:multidrug efflux pump subunit AcrA (membrane-fusion protein)
MDGAITGSTILFRRRARRAHRRLLRLLPSRSGRWATACCRRGAPRHVGPNPAPSTTVAADRIEIVDDLIVTRRFTGQFEPLQEVALGFEEGGTIAEVLVREGLGVSRGEVIARLDTRLLEADRARLSASRAALAAQVELARRTDARQQTLLAEGHVTQQRVDETSLLLAQLEAALAEADAGHRRR